MRRRDPDATEATLRLLERAKAAGLLAKDIARVLGISPQQVSIYRHAPMPRNNRRVLADYIDLREGDNARTPLYPSQQAAIEHDNVERLARLTGASGPLWRIYREMTASIIRMAEEAAQAEQVENPRSDGYHSV
jgi:hypothetical protein